jgi:hypothetical protein
MKIKIVFILLISFHFCVAQIGMGTNSSPNSSSILDIASTNKGLLTPRLTNAQRDAIIAPATGLLIYNTDDSDFNSYNGSLLGWQDFSTAYMAVAATSEIITTATVDEIATGMTITPKKGTYSVLFNSQFKNSDNYTSTASTVGSILVDLSTLISDLDNYFILGTPEYNSIGHVHYSAGIQAPGEQPISNDYQANYANLALTLYPGAYYEGAALNFVGGAVVTFDGLGDPNAKFIFKANAAINTGIGVTMNLINGAKANNIFWLATGAMSIGATNEMKGNCVSRAGAMAVGIATNLDGRILTSAGALTMGNGTLSIPSEPSFINLRTLVSFLGFTGAGDINITGAPATTNTTIIGDLFTCEAFNNFGFIPPFGGITNNSQPIVGPPVTLVGKLYHCSGPQIITGSVVNDSNSSGTFSFYKNNILIPFTAKTVVSNKNSDIITLQTIAIFNGTDAIDVRWKTADGNTLLMGNRNLTLIKVQ